jgi:hypothetical protein
MAIILKRTSDSHINGVKIVVFGMAGSGKTRLCATLPDPLVISAEAGLLSLRGMDLPYVEVNSYDSLKEAYEFVTTSHEGTNFQSIAIDSLSEIGEVVLAHEKRVNKDGRAAYGEMAVQVLEMMRAFRDISGKNVYFSAKCEKQQDETGKILYSPSMPGAKLGQQIPYMVDELLALRIEKDAEGEIHRALMCQSDGIWQAKDRSGALDTWEPADLGAIIEKIGGGK